MRETFITRHSLGFEELGFLAVVVAILALFIWFIIWTVNLGESPEHLAAMENWRNAEVVKICADGTRIFRLNDGTFRTGDWGASRVKNPETVCDARKN